MAQKKKRDYKTFHIYVNKEEHDQVVKKFKATSCQSLSEYARKAILGGPVTIHYRDRAFDGFTESFIRFKRDSAMVIEKGAWTPIEKELLLRQLQEIKETGIKIIENVCKNPVPFRDHSSDPLQ